MGVKRGSQTMIVFPAFFAWRTRRAASGCASTLFAPIMKMRSAFKTSSKGFVAAPEPNESERPATDGPWQMRAQLSTLFVLKATRASFCMI